MMIWLMLGLLLAAMLIGIPILLCIALVGFVGIAAEPGIVMPLFAVGVRLFSDPLQLKPGPAHWIPLPPPPKGVEEAQSGF